MDRGILAATLALAVAATLALAAAATLALSSGYTQTAGRLLSDAPAAIDGGAQAATARAPAPATAPARDKRDAPAPATTSTVGDQRGLALYFLIEAARPLPLFAR